MLSRCPSPQEAASKRQILAFIAQIYDPLGALSPVTMTAKSFLQALWTHRLDWDSPLPAELADQWRTIRHDLLTAPLMSLPRALFFQATISN